MENTDTEAAEEEAEVDVVEDRMTAPELIEKRIDM